MLSWKSMIATFFKGSNQKSRGTRKRKQKRENKPDLGGIHTWLGHSKLMLNSKAQGSC